MSNNPYDPNPTLTAAYLQWSCIVTLRQTNMTQIGQFLDQLFLSFWSSAVDPRLLATIAGTTLLAGFAAHANLGALVIADELARGLTPNRPWAFFVGGQWITGVPQGWSYTPTLAAGLPTGAATVFPVPAIVTPAAVQSAGPTSASLACLAAYGSGESNLTYTWSCPTAGVTFGSNGTNAAKNTVATFPAAGSYALTCTVSDGTLSAATSVTFTAAQIQSSVTVTPATVSVAPAGTQSFAAQAIDQFGIAMNPQPAFAWSCTSGSITSSGIYTAPSDGTLSDTVTATAGNQSAASQVTITA